MQARKIGGRMGHRPERVSGRDGVSCVRTRASYRHGLARIGSNQVLLKSLEIQKMAFAPQPAADRDR